MSSETTKLAYILVCVWCGDRNCCVDLVSVSLASMGKGDFICTIFIMEFGELSSIRSMLTSVKY